MVRRLPLLLLILFSIMVRAIIHCGTAMSADGKYWVRLKVDPTGGEPISYFAKPIVLEPDFELTVHPTSIREDDDRRPTEITIRVKVRDGTEVDKDTPVHLNLASYTRNFSDRFSIGGLPSLVIPDGETEAVLKTTLTPIDNEDGGFEGDLPIRIEGSVVGKSVESTEIMLIDDDKESNYINLSFSPSELNRRDSATRCRSDGHPRWKGARGKPEFWLDY